MIALLVQPFYGLQCGGRLHDCTADRTEAARGADAGCKFDYVAAPAIGAGTSGCSIRSRIQQAAVGALCAACASPTSSGQQASVEQQALLRMACWTAGDAAKEVVGRMYAAAGSIAVLEEVRFSAQLRDVHAACRHINFATRLMLTPGRILLGLEPGTMQI